MAGTGTDPCTAQPVHKQSLQLFVRHRSQHRHMKMLFCSDIFETHMILIAMHMDMTSLAKTGRYECYNADGNVHELQA